MGDSILRGGDLAKVLEEMARVFYPVHVCGDVGAQHLVAGDDKPGVNGMHPSDTVHLFEASAHKLSKSRRDWVPCIST